MSCETWLSEIEPYIDGQLSAERAADFERHARECPRCSSEVWNGMRLKRQIQRAGMTHSPDPAFRARMLRQIGDPKPRVFAVLWPVAVAAIMVLAAVVALWVNETATSRNAVLANVVDRHVTALASAQLVDVVSTDRHTVKPWFQGKLPFSINLPEVAGTKFTLAGGRMVFLNGEPGAHLIYNVRLHHVSVLIVPDRAREGLGAGDTLRDWRSFHIESWSAHGLTYFVVGDCATEDIRELAKLLQNADRTTSAP